MTEERCQNARALKAMSHGEIEYSDVYWCDLSDNPCGHYTRGDYCETWEIKKKEIEGG